MKTARAFTLVEIMVAMVVLAVGLLGMAAMTILVMRGNKGADQITIATSLATQKMEALKDIGFTNLGTATNDTTDANYYSWGVMYQGGGEPIFIREPGPLNALGESSASPGADYVYWRAFAICDSTDANGPCDGICTASLCDLMGTADDGLGNMDPTSTPSVPVELACSTDSANDDEKRIRVVTYWLDRFKACHRVAMDTIVVNLAP